MRYRRANIQGACYFFTVALANRESSLLVEHIEKLRQAFRLVKQRHPFEIVAMVVMPEHLHAIWQLPAGDADFALRWSLIKSGFSRAIPMHEYIRPSRAGKRERGLWQRRYWEHLIRDDNDLARHVDYIHYNPVKHGLVQRAIDWPHTSIHRYVRLGWLKDDWGTGDEDAVVDFGEPV